MLQSVACFLAGRSACLSVIFCKLLMGAPPGYGPGALPGYIHAYYFVGPQILLYNSWT